MAELTLTEVYGHDDHLQDPDLFGRSVLHRRGWTELTWISPQHRLPGPADGVLDPETGKVMVWVLTLGASLRGSDPEVVGFHPEHRVFDDDDHGSHDQVMVWAPLKPEDIGK